MTRASELAAARSARFRSRATLRRAALAPLTRLSRHSAPRGVRIVHYHFVFDDELAPFRNQLEWLATSFEPVSLSEAVARLRQGEVRGRELAITFDDGFRNQAVNAAPLLREAGFQACFFLITELVGANDARGEKICRDVLHLPRPVEPMSWDDARALAANGHEIGSHTRTHPDLATLPAPELESELTGSRAELEAELGRPVRHVSAPYGDPARFSAAVSAAARAAGYTSCASALRGVNPLDADVFALRRDHLAASWPVRDVRYFLSR